MPKSLQLMWADLTEAGVIHGTHLEGPWIAPEYKGAHDLATLRDPEPEEVDQLIRIGRGTRRMVTLAPEWPNGIEAVLRFVAAGAIAAIGHTNATYTRTRQAIDAGATCSTHLFNAERPVNHREPGPIVALTRTSESPTSSSSTVSRSIQRQPRSLSAPAKGAS